MAGSQKIYDGVIDFNVENNSHTKAYRFIGRTEKKKRLLEVGCSKGYFGAALKNEGYEVWGVEPSASAAEEAKKHLDSVYHGFIQDFFNQAGSIKFDYITFGDVIEHLYDPVEVLQQCKVFLSSNGSIVCSIPNVAHLAVRAMLLEGRWEYSDMGILDDTHVRFYTRVSVAEMLAKAGYELMAIDFVRLTAQEVDNIYKMNIDLNLLNVVGSLVSDDDKDIFQFVFRARPSDMDPDSLKSKNINKATEKRKNILCIVPFHGSTLIDIRMRLPLEKWAEKYNGNLRVIEAHCVKEDDAKWADIAVFSRETNSMTSYCERLMRCYSVLVIFEIDDLLTNVPNFLSVYEHAMNNKAGLCEMMKVSDVITTTTEHLAQKLRVYNESVHVIPNCAELGAKLPPFSFQSTGKVSLILASSDTIRIEFIADALLEVIERAQKKGVIVEIIGVGPPGEWLSSKGIDVILVPNMPYVDFRDFLEGQSNAIGIIPLDGSEFSSCKSPIKYIDYSFSGIPCVCSNVSPYSDYIVNKCTGILVNNDTEAWVNGLFNLIESNVKRNEISEAAWKYCQANFTMDVSAKLWNDLFQDILSASTLVDQDDMKCVDFKTRPNTDRLYQKALHHRAYVEYKNNGFASLMKKARLWIKFNLKP